MIRLLFFIILVAAGADVYPQTTSEYTNDEAHYAFTPSAGWRVRATGPDSYAYAPPDGTMDPWDEKIVFSITDGEDIELNDAFDFYINTDFPQAYSLYKLVNQGSEQINGLQARWATFTFSAEGIAEGGTGVGDSTVSASLQALFYVIKKGNTLYLINGVTEKNLFTRFDAPFRTIIRTFRVKE